MNVTKHASFAQIAREAISYVALLIPHSRNENSVQIPFWKRGMELTGSECETSWVMLWAARTSPSLCIAATAAGCCSVCCGTSFFSTRSALSCSSCSVRNSPRSALRCSLRSRSSCFWCSFSANKSHELYTLQKTRILSSSRAKHDISPRKNGTTMTPSCESKRKGHIFAGFLALDFAGNIREN